MVSWREPALCVCAASPEEHNWCLEMNHGRFVYTMKTGMWALLVPGKTFKVHNTGHWGRWGESQGTQDTFLGLQQGVWTSADLSESLCGESNGNGSTASQRTREYHHCPFPNKWHTSLFVTAEPRGCLSLSLCSITGSLYQLNMGGQKEKQIFLIGFKCRQCHFCVSLDGSVVGKEM